MGYFSSFLMMHLYFKHRFTSTGSWIVDQLFRLLVYFGLAFWASLVCYSRYHLTYHTAPQVFYGLSIGICFGISSYLLVELIPSRYPESSLGQLKECLLDSQLARFVRLRDGWAIWEDAGREHEWTRWRSQWERLQGRRWKERHVNKQSNPEAKLRG